MNRPKKTAKERRAEREARDRYLSCESKIRYTDHADAERQLQEIVGRRRKSRGSSHKRRRMFRGVKLRSYRCRHCGGWHHGQSVG